MSFDGMDGIGRMVEAREVSVVEALFANALYVCAASDFYLSWQNKSRVDEFV